MEVIVSDHPVMANVHKFGGNPFGETPFSPGQATNNTTTVARWKMDYVNKPVPLIVEKHGLNGKVVALNFTPHSSSLPLKRGWWHIGKSFSLPFTINSATY